MPPPGISLTSHSRLPSSDMSEGGAWTVVFGGAGPPLAVVPAVGGGGLDEWGP